MFHSVPLLQFKKKGKKKKKAGLLKAHDFDSMMIILMSFLLLALANANLILANPALAIQWRAINYCYPLVTVSVKWPYFTRV